MQIFFFANCWRNGIIFKTPFVMIDNWRAFMPFIEIRVLHISKNYRTKNCSIRIGESLNEWNNKIQHASGTQYFLVRRSQRLATDNSLLNNRIILKLLVFLRRKKVNDFLIKRLFSHFFFLLLYRCTILHMQRKQRKHITICMWMSCEDRTPTGY